VQIDTRSGPFVVTNSSNVAAASITFPLPTTLRPSGDGVIAMGGDQMHQGALAPNSLMIVPFGTGSSTQTFTMNAYGWRETTGATGTAGTTGTMSLWVAVELATFTCTLCTVPGIAGTDVNASQLFVGTITLGVGNANVSNEIISPTGNVVAHIILDAKGSRFVELRFAKGTNTDCNALVARL